MNMRKQLCLSVNLLADIKLNLKHGTTKTFVKTKVIDSFTVLVCVTATILPSGSVTDALIVAVKVVKYLRKQTICCEAPMSTIHLSSTARTLRRVIT